MTVINNFGGITSTFVLIAIYFDDCSETRVTRNEEWLVSNMQPEREEYRRRIYINTAIEKLF